MPSGPPTISKEPKELNCVSASPVVFQEEQEGGSTLCKISCILMKWGQTTLDIQQMECTGLGLKVLPVALILFLALPGCSLANSHAFLPISVLLFSGLLDQQLCIGEIRIKWVLLYFNLARVLSDENVATTQSIA